jgi:hypothetical protein
MRKLEIIWGELEVAFQSNSWDMHFYLDLETGGVVMVTDEVARYVEQPPDYELPEWMEQDLQIARQVEEGSGTRYIRIPEADSRAAYRDMEHFIYTVDDSRLQDRLGQAIRGRGAFRRFKNVLIEHPTERERWFAFKDRCTYERMLDWLEGEEIEPTNPLDLSPEIEPESEEEPSRDALIEELTLLLIYLCSWEEELAPDLTVRRAWKGYLFEVLDALEEQGYIAQTRSAKSLKLTEEGVLRAREIQARYT